MVRKLEFKPSLALNNIDPFAVMMITGSTNRGPGREVFDVGLYSDTGHPSLVIFNGGAPVPKQKYGFGIMDSPTFAAYDDADVPALGEEWGPKANSKKLHKGYPGFTILSAGTTTADGTKVVRVSRTHGEVVRLFKLKATLAAGGNANSAFVDEDDGTTELETFTAYDRMDQFEGISGTKGYVKWSAVALKWLIIQLGCGG